MEKAALYREAIEAELDASPLAAKSERDLVQDNVNTIGQIFTNYQAALHLFEQAVQAAAHGEAVPRELATRGAARGRARRVRAGDWPRRPRRRARSPTTSPTGWA